MRQVLRYGCSQSQAESSEEANFGYRRVKVEEKQSHVDEVFHKVAAKYDLMNDLMSVGIHRCWKDSFVNEAGRLEPQRIKHPDGTVEERPVRVLDVAGGTGDIAFRLLDRFKAHRGQFLSQAGMKVTVLDINQSMLDVGLVRSREKHFKEDEIDFVCANAEQLPFEDNLFDLYTIAFGIRNVPRIDKALKEAHRVLKPGGKFQCLEFSKVNNPILSVMNQAYQFACVPIMGQLVAGDRASYQYLVESIDKFHTQEELRSMV
jgi:ubiquinone/menaquinone biosynthesis methyltransferase